jgi:hypothetical protein
MATIAITALPAATAAAVGDVLPIVQSGTTKQVTNALLFTNATLVAPALGTVASGNISACTSTGMVLTAPALGTVASGNISACTSTNMVLTTPVIGAATGTSLVLSSFNATNAAAPTIASATTIAPTKQITFISGTTAVVTITAAAPISTGGGAITLIPTGIFTWTTAGNIALAGTAVVSKALTMTYDATTTKWYPSYVA